MGAWAASVLLGAAAIGAHAASGSGRQVASPFLPRPAPTPTPTPTSTGTPSTTLLPSQLAASLAALAGAGATDLRVVSLLGSGHDGDWTYSAYLTWRSPDGARHAGVTALPFPGGTEPPTPDLALTVDEQAAVDRDGWTVASLTAALSSAGDLDLADLGHLEIDGPLGADPTLVLCTASPTDGAVTDRGRAAGDCTQVDQAGHRSMASRTLTYDHDTGSLTVHVMAS